MIKPFDIHRFTSVYFGKKKPGKKNDAKSMTSADEIAIPLRIHGRNGIFTHMKTGFLW